MYIYRGADLSNKGLSNEVLFFDHIGSPEKGLLFFVGHVVWNIQLICKLLRILFRKSDWMFVYVRQFHGVTPNSFPPLIFCCCSLCNYCV